MEEETFNPMGISMQRLMDIVRNDFVPDDDKTYIARFDNKSKEKYVAVSIEQVATIEGAQNKIVSSMSVGYDILNTDVGAFDLQETWNVTIVYPPGEVDA